MIYTFTICYKSVSEQPLTVIESIEQSVLETVLSHTRTVSQPTRRSLNNER